MTVQEERARAFQAKRLYLERKAINEQIAALQKQAKALTGQIKLQFGRKMRLELADGSILERSTVECPKRVQAAYSYEKYKLVVPAEATA